MLCEHTVPFMHTGGAVSARLPDPHRGRRRARPVRRARARARHARPRHRLRRVSAELTGEVFPTSSSERAAEAVAQRRGDNSRQVGPTRQKCGIEDGTQRDLAPRLVRTLCLLCVVVSMTGTNCARQTCEACTYCITAAARHRRLSPPALLLLPARAPQLEPKTRPSQRRSFWAPCSWGTYSWTAASRTAARRCR